MGLDDRVHPALKRRPGHRQPACVSPLQVGSGTRLEQGRFKFMASEKGQYPGHRGVEIDGRVGDVGMGDHQTAEDTGRRIGQQADAHVAGQTGLFGQPPQPVVLDDAQAFILQGLQQLAGHALRQRSGMEPGQGVGHRADSLWCEPVLASSRSAYARTCPVRGSCRYV